MTRQFRSIDGSVKLYKAWGRRQFMSHLAGMYESLRDTSELGRAGITVGVLEGKALLSGEDSDWHMANEDELARAGGHFADRLFATRLASMLLYSDWYPWALVQLYRARGEEEKAALRRLRVTCNALNAASRSESDELRDLSSTCSLQTPLMRVILSHLVRVHFSCVPAQVQHMLHAMFSGFGTSRINEECHHHLREAEMKGNMSRSVKGQRCWSTCIEREILKQYGREEVQPSAGGRQQSNAEMGKSFASDLTTEIMKTETAATELGADVVGHWGQVQESMRGVLDADQKGIGGSHSSDIKSMSALNAVITLHVRHELALWDKSWMSALVPCHE
eukprot:3723575-Amphidinium_carterae.1